MFDEETSTPAKATELERARAYFRAAAAASQRRPQMILAGLLLTGVETAFHTGLSKEEIAMQLRTLADHVVNGTCPILFVPNKFELKGKKRNEQRD